ncbi:hypothetical protein F4604DRAFT_1934402 [Suillus subluteus]|nr:hypothetical protein F4604DRAFT_1934402 [Suillus subluteus]
MDFEDDGTDAKAEGDTISGPLFSEFYRTCAAQSVRSVGIMDFSQNTTVRQQLNEPGNATLLRHGLLGCSPIQPTVAIHLECLELYHQIRRRQSSFSIQSITRVLCALHNSQFTTAFDIYIQIQRSIQQRINLALNRNPADWHMNGVCPCCAFEQPNELNLVPRQLHSMDGNHSAKRIDGSGSADPRIFKSDYFITNDIVEQFRDDVRNHLGERNTIPNPSCTDNWTAAKSHEEDKISVFEQTGIFLMACRHGFVECIIEMRCSGELAKYGLAAIDQMLDVCGKDQALGYDIGCSSHKTVAASSIAAKANANNLVIAVNAFHGYAHNHQCQLANHPLYLNGFGIEDLETCKWIFSSSNSVASLIRHTSYFHWVQFLDLHFDQWDKDKYLELSRFLHNNYIQALRTINDFTPLLDDFKLRKSLTDEDFVQWKHEESEFLANLSRESPADVFAVTYVEEMEKLRFLEAKYGSIMSVPFLMYTTANFTASSGLDVPMQEHSKATEAERTSALRRLQLQMNVVEDFEHRHGIGECWIPSDPRYVQALEYSSQRRFIHVVEELEGLVVQRLFELSKVNLSGTALDRYNKLAPLQVPPRPILDYAEVVGYAALGEFTLLKHSCHDLLTRPWATPENHEMAAKFFKVLCSHEEITCLNVEIGRLHAWMEFEEKSMVSAIAALNREASPLLASELQRQYAARRCVNNIHRARLQGVCLLDGYTGALHSTLSSQELTEEEEEDEECSDEVHEEATRLADAITRIIV